MPGGNVPLLIFGGAAITITYTIDKELRVVLSEIQGACSLQERKAFLDDLAADPSYPPGFSILYDQRACTSVLTAEENRSLVTYAGRHKQTFDGIRLAVVVNKDAMYGLARMQDMLGSGPGMEVVPFRDYQQALDWVTS